MRPETSTQINHYTCNSNRPTTSAASIKPNKISYHTYNEKTSTNLLQKNNLKEINGSKHHKPSSDHSTLNCNKSAQANEIGLKLVNSTQIDHQNNPNRPSSSAAITPILNNTKENNAPLLSGPNYSTTSTSSQISLTPSNQFEERVFLIMKETLREVKLLRREFRDFKDKCTCQAQPTINEEMSLQIPANSIEDFNKLENDIKTDNRTEMCLKKHIISDPSMEKYIRCCLKSVLTDKAASYFSWYGQHGNIAVKTYAINQLLKDAAIKKFNSRTVDIETTVKKWFQYAKDRDRIKQKKTISECQVSQHDGYVNKD